MSCGTRLTAVVVGLSIVALDDVEVKTPVSMAYSHSYCCELSEAIFVLLDNGSNIPERTDVSNHQLLGTSYK